MRLMDELALRGVQAGGPGSGPHPGANRDANIASDKASAATRYADRTKTSDAHTYARDEHTKAAELSTKALHNAKAWGNKGLVSTYQSMVRHHNQLALDHAATASRLRDMDK